MTNELAEYKAAVIVGNCCMCRNPDITTPNPDMCRECKLRIAIAAALIEAAKGVSNVEA